jgi:hypothetical protein
MNGVEAKKAAVALSFLGSGTWHAMEVRDSGETVELARRDVRRGETVQLDLPPGGGTLMRFTR